jgi:hypothetical protein
MESFRTKIHTIVLSDVLIERDSRVFHAFAGISWTAQHSLFETRHAA